jgi:hypothetical protein
MQLMGIASLHPSYALMKIRKRFHREEDGEFISAAIYSGEEELLVHDRRVGFIAGTAPDDKQKAMNVVNACSCLEFRESTSPLSHGEFVMVAMLCDGRCLTKSSSSASMTIHPGDAEISQ